MANQALFKSARQAAVPAADTHNEAGGIAYRLSPKQMLAQYAMTGCLNSTFYASAEAQLDMVLALCAEVEPEFIAKTAIYARRRGHMKDLPALLVASLSVLGPQYLAPAFRQAIDNGKMLRNFVQIMRSGVLSRKSLGTRPKKLVQEWLNQASDEALVNAMVGQSPSLVDVLKMVHPKPADAKREAFFGYLIGREHNVALLPEAVRAFEAFKAGKARANVKVPFQLLTAQPLSTEDWKQIARNGSWQMTRMNLNTFARHGVFTDPKLVRLVAERLRDPQAIAKARVLPYQLLAAYRMVDPAVPQLVREALHEALDIALANVPQFNGKVVVFPDVSGSMSSPVTGHRAGATTAVRCIDVAALVAAAVLAKNPNAEVLPFDTRVHAPKISRRDSVLTNADRLAAYGGGGTSCHLPLAELNQRGTEADLLIYVSDNESWVDTKRHGATATMQEWLRFKQRNPRAKLVCIDIQPYATTQAQERADVLNIGGFSDAVFEVIAAFAAGELSADHWVGVIDKVELAEAVAAA